MSTKKRIQSIVKKIGEKAGKPLGNTLASYQRVKSYSKRQKMISKQVEKIVRQKYGGGQPLSSSAANVELRKKERKKLIATITKKNKRLLKF